MRRTTILILTLIFITGLALAQEKRTENTLRLAAGQIGERASIADVAWLAGNWVGTGLGGISEETWSAPSGGTMVGYYRLIKNGEPVFYESMWVLEQGGTLILRLKHFHPDLIGWEEKDKTVDFRFVKNIGMRAYFSGLTYERVGKNELKVYLALRQKDGTTTEEVFVMKRKN